MATQGAPVSAPTPPSRRPRRRAAAVLATSLVVVLVATWALVATRPSLVDAGAWYVDPVFVQQPDDSSEVETWAAWDAPDGGWVSVAFENGRPWPVTVAAPPRALADHVVQVARAEQWPYVIDLDHAGLDYSDRVTVPAHGVVAIAVHVSSRCYEMGAETARTASSATVDVTSLGLTTSQTVLLPATYSAGYTTDHVPPADCAP